MRRKVVSFHEEEENHLPLHLSLTSGLQEMCYFEVQKSGNAFMNIIEYMNM